MVLQTLETAPHILVVDDDARIRDLVSRYLHDHNFVVMGAKDGAQARILLQRFAFDVLVVDVMMPGETGLELTKFVSERYGVPVILLTALGETDDRIAGLESGADDYLPKPFDPKELVLRLQAILRRTARTEQGVKPFALGVWRYDPSREELRSHTGDVLGLTSAEMLLIKTLAMKAGSSVSREALAQALGADPNTRSIDVQVTRLRRKIEEDTKNPRYLQTVRGKGYVLRVEAVS